MNRPQLTLVLGSDQWDALSACALRSATAQSGGYHGLVVSRDMTRPSVFDSGAGGGRLRLGPCVLGSHLSYTRHGQGVPIIAQSKTRRRRK